MKFALTSALVLVVLVSRSQELWLQPQKFRFMPGEEAKVMILMGEQFGGQPLDFQQHKVVKAEVITAYGKKDLMPLVKTGKGTHIVVKPANEGIQLLTLESDTADRELGATDFNSYLANEGLDDIARTRKQEGNLDKPARERYRFYTRLLLQSGSRADEIYMRKVGQMVEIIPQQNPHKLQSGDYLDCLVLIDGKPGAHRKIRIWTQIGKSIFEQNAFTENDGTFRFPISNSGRWMVSTVYMTRSGHEGIDYERFSASLVFGID